MEKFVKLIFPESGSSWKNWDYISKLTIVLWLLSQVILIIVFWNVEQRSDQGAYIRIATDYYNRGSWYPDDTEIYSSYIWAPGLINLFILELKIFGSLKVNYLINLLFNIGILWNVRFLAKKKFSERTSFIASTLFCILYSNIMVVLPAGTEVPFLFLALSSFTLSLSNKNIARLVCAGIAIAIANWIRPLGILFLFVTLLYMVLNKSKIWHFAALLIPIISLNIAFGWLSMKQMGHFTFQSTTSGFNLIMTANDRAYGGVATSLAGDTTSTVFIKDAANYTFQEKDSIWKARSIEWIKQHPIKYTGLYIAKLAGMYVEDSWAERPIIGGDGFVDKAAHGMADSTAVVKRIWNMFSKSIIYYFVLIISLITIFKFRKEMFSDKGYILLITLLGTLSTCIFSVTPRYHYPFLFSLIIWAAYGIDRYILKQKKSHHSLYGVERIQQ